jgi:Flp pilus assembly protein TadG
MASTSTDTKKSSGALGLFSRFRRDKRGVTAVEFGFIAIPFLGLLLATLETGFVFLVNANLNSAVIRSSRAILTGVAQANNVYTASGFLKNYVCPATGQTPLASFINCNQLIVDVRTTTTFTAADTSNDFYKTQTTNEFCPGPPNTITIVRIAYPMPSYLPLLQIGGMNSGSINTSGLVNDVPGNPGWKHLLVGTSVFTTEPYPTTSYVKPAGC